MLRKKGEVLVGGGAEERNKATEIAKFHFCRTLEYHREWICLLDRASQKERKRRQEGAMQHSCAFEDDLRLHTLIVCVDIQNKVMTCRTFRLVGDSRVCIENRLWVSQGCRGYHKLTNPENPREVDTRKRMAYFRSSGPNGFGFFENSFFPQDKECGHFFVTLKNHWPSCHSHSQ